MDKDDDAVTTPAVSRAWIVTFTDLVSLMLTFFVMLFAMSNVKVDRWEAMTDALSRTLSPNNGAVPATATAKFNVATVVRKAAINLDYLAGVLQETVVADQLLSQSRIVRLEDRLIIALPGDLLFQPGKAELSARARDALFSLGGVLRNLGNEIGVNGHTDPVPPVDSIYPSNWELSLARALSVAEALRHAGYPQDIVSYGFADSRFGELPDLPLDQRRALGRRVDIVILPYRGEF